MSQSDKESMRQGGTKTKGPRDQTKRQGDKRHIKGAERQRNRTTKGKRHKTTKKDREAKKQ